MDHLPLPESPQGQVKTTKIVSSIPLNKLFETEITLREETQWLTINEIELGICGANLNQEMNGPAFIKDWLSYQECLESWFSHASAGLQR